MQKIHLLIYYFIAQYLPCPPVKFILSFSKPFRCFLCRKLFKKMEKNIDIQPHAYIGNGQCISIGNDLSLGRNFTVHNTILEIESNVMTASDLFIMGEGHKNDRLDIPMGLQGIYEKGHLIIGNDVWIGAR